MVPGAQDKVCPPLPVLLRAPWLAGGFFAPWARDKVAWGSSVAGEQALCLLPILEINEGAGWAGSAGPGDAWPAWVPTQQAWVQGHLCVPGPQRWNPVGGFCEKLLLSDRWAWSDVTGLQHRPLDGVALPSPHWEWESDWYVDENFGGEPTEKGVGELRTLHDCLVGRGRLGLRLSLLLSPTPCGA